MRRSHVVHELRLCESENLILKPDVLYRFSVDTSCARCQQLSAAYDTEPSTMTTTQSKFFSATICTKTIGLAIHPMPPSLTLRELSRLIDDLIELKHEFYNAIQNDRESTEGN